MGRLITLGIGSEAMDLMGPTAERPASANPGVLWFNTDSNQLEIYNGTAWHVVGDFEYNTISTNTNAEANRSYFVNTSSGVVTLTLPANPNTGDFIKITDVAGTFGTNALTVARNGRPIMRQADDMTVDTNGASIRMVYYDNTRGWLLENI